MACKHISTGGLTMIVCGRGQRTKPCHYCGRPSSYLCDHPVIRNGKRQTCDVPMCQACACEVAKDTDLCRAHFGLWQKNGCCFKLGDIEVK
jgi:hypothetical protein